MRIVGIGALVAALPLASGAVAQTVPQNLRSLIERNQSFGLSAYPIGFWNYTNLGDHGQYMDEAEVEEWADAGFTVTLSPSFDPASPEQVEHMRRLLDWAGAQGMKLILVDPRTHGPRPPAPDQPAVVAPEYAARVAEAMADLGAHPAVFGHHIGDEPGEFENDAWFECYRITKDAAPNLHPFLNLLPWYGGAEGRVGYPGWPEYLDAVAQRAGVDFLCYDCYAQMNPDDRGWDMYFQNLRYYREAAVRNGVPFWNTVLSVGHFHYRCPNYDELRWQFNTSVCSGANGILWFFYYMRQPHANYRLSPVDENWDRTTAYYDLRRFQKAFHRMYGDLFLRVAPTRVTFSPTAFGGGETFTPSDVLSAVEAGDHPMLVGEFVDLEGRRYVMAVNNSTTKSVRVGLTFPGSDARVFSWNWNGQEYEGGAYSADTTERVEGGLRLWHWLAPGQEAVYRVDSELTRAGLG